MRYSQGRPYWGPPQRDSFYPSLYYYCYTHLHARTLPPALSGRHQGRHRGQHLDRRRGQHRGRHVEEAKVRKAIRQLKLQPWSIHVTKIPGKSSNEEIYRELREWYRRVAKSTLQCSDQDDRLLLPDHLLGPPFRSNNRDTVRVHVTLKDKAMRRELLQNRDDNNDFYGDGSTKIEVRLPGNDAE